MTLRLYMTHKHYIISFTLYCLHTSQKMNMRKLIFSAYMYVYMHYILHSDAGHACFAVSSSYCLYKLVK